MRGVGRRVSGLGRWGVSRRGIRDLDDTSRSLSRDEIGGGSDVDCWVWCGDLLYVHAIRWCIIAGIQNEIVVGFVYTLFVTVATIVLLLFSSLTICAREKRCGLDRPETVNYKKRNRMNASSLLSTPARPTLNSHAELPHPINPRWSPFPRLRKIDQRFSYEVENASSLRQRRQSGAQE